MTAGKYRIGAIMMSDIRRFLHQEITAVAPALLVGFLLAVSSGAAQESRPAAPLSANADKHSEGWNQAMKLKGPPLPPKFPVVGKEIERVVLENGLIVYMQEDHRLPLFDAVAMVRAGSYYETPEELRTATLLGEMMRRGGTKNYNPDQLEEKLDSLVANLNVSMQQESCSVSINLLQKDAAEGLKILSEVLRNPDFDGERLELAKRQTLFNLRSSNDSPGPILRREFARLLYTEAHPAGRTPTFERIQKIERGDLDRFHQKYFHPNQVMIGLTGDFNKAEMLQMIREIFGDWPRAQVSLPPLPKVNPQPKPGVYYVSKPINQSHFYLGHWGINRENPDRFAISLMNDILGGGSLTSRLGKRVRNDEGLAYSVGSSYPTSTRDINFFISAAQTKTESTVQAIQSTLDEIHKMMTTKITKNEFDMAKEMFLYSYVFNYSEPSRSLGAVMGVEFDGLPADYLEKEFAGYQAVTAADIERVAKQYLKPDQATIFIVGDFAKIASQAAALGEAKELQPFNFGEPPARGR
ncbi:MAG: insulinase family protein [Bryobacterales bacterium]|nr:insulinase family protein [Bryobacterales bacterium]